MLIKEAVGPQENVNTGGQIYKMCFFEYIFISFKIICIYLLGFAWWKCIFIIFLVTNIF